MMIVKSVRYGKSLLLTVLLMTVLSCSDLSVDENALMTAARTYLENNEIGAAAIELRNVLQQNPDNAEARFLLARVSLDVGDFETAEKEYRRARAAGWAAAEAVYGAQRARFALGDFDALFASHESDTEWPATVRANLLGLRAAAEIATEQREAAMDTLESARQIDAHAVDVLKSEIRLHMLAQRSSDADRLLQAALARYPDDRELLLMSAGLVSNEQPDRAMAIYRDIIDRDPVNFTMASGRVARLRLAQLLIHGQEFEAAQQAISPLSRDGRDPIVNYISGVLAFQQRDYYRAEELLLKVLEIAPDHNPSRLLYGTVSYARKNYEQAAYFLSKYLGDVPENTVARKLLARSHILLGNNDESIRVLAAIPEVDTDDAELMALTAISELRRGGLAAGVAGLEQAVKAEPASTALRSELARAYIEIGETGQAIRELRGLLAQDDDRQLQTQSLLVLAHLRAGESSEAISQVLEMVSANRENKGVLTLAGNVFAATGDATEARRYFEKVLAVDAAFAPALLSLARIEEQQDALSQAAGLYQRLVKVGPPTVIPYLALARIAEKRGDLEAMRGWLEQGLQALPEDTRPRIYLAEHSLRSGELRVAGRYVAEGLKLSPASPELLALSGRVAMAGGNYREALEPLETLVRNGQDKGRVRLLLGETYLQLGRLDDARAEFRQILQKDPDDTDVRAAMIRLEIRSGDHAQALAQSRRLQADLPTSGLGFELAGDSLMIGQQVAVAMQEYERAWALEPSSRLVIKRAAAARLSGDARQSIDLLEQWVQSHPADTRVAQALGTGLQADGRTAAAIRVYEGIIARAPDNAVALNNLAGLYLAVGRAEALDLAKRAWQVAGDNPGVQDTYGWALVQAGQYGRGLELLERARKALPDVAEVRYHHAVALYRAGRKDAALKSLRELLDQQQEFDGRAEAERLLQEWQGQAALGGGKRFAAGSRVRTVVFAQVSDIDIKYLSA